MRKLLAVAALGAAMIVGSASPSQAVSVGFAPANQTVNNGASVSLDLVISGLGVPGALGLGAFDLEIVLSNPSIVSFGSYSLGPWLGAVGTESDDFSAGFNGTNTIHLSQLSYINASALLAHQAPAGGTFTLGTLTFTATHTGTTFLTIVNPLLSDENGTAGGLQATNSQGQINVAGPTQVPEAGTLLMVGLGLAMFARKRRR